MPIIDDPRDSQSIIAGPMRALPDDPAKIEDSGFDVIASAMRQSNLASAAYTRVTNPDPDLPDAPPGWDPLDHIQGYEDHAEDFIDVQTPSELQGKINRLQVQDADRQVLDRAGALGTISQIGATVLDPSFLASAAVPEMALARSARIGSIITSATRGAVGAGAYEAGMHALQEDRPLSESALNIAGGALISGVLGSVLHTVPAGTTRKLVNAVDQELPRSEAGAAASSRPTTLAEETIARGGAGVSKLLARIPLIGTDLDKVMASESVNARTVLQDLSEIPQAMDKNKQFIRTPDAVENTVIRREAVVADFIDHVRSQWKDYRTRVPKDQQLSREDFHRRIAEASRRGDAIGIPEIDKAAQFLRSKIFDPPAEEAKELGLLRDPIKEATERVEKKAIDKYFDAQESQLFADYQARTRQAIEKGFGEGGDAEVLGTKSGHIQEELARAIETESTAHEQTMADSSSRLEQAKAAHDQKIQQARANLEATFKAAKEEASLLSEKAATDSARRAEQISLGRDTARSTREVSIQNAKGELEDAVRQHEITAREARRDLPYDKARIAILKSKLGIANLRRSVAKKISEARKQHSEAIKGLKSQFSESEIDTAPNDQLTARAVRDYRKEVADARRELAQARKSEDSVTRKERARSRKVRSKLKSQAVSSIDDLKVDRLKAFRKRAEKAALGEAENDPAVKELAKLIKDKEAGSLKSRVIIPKIDESRIRTVVGAKSYFRRMYDTKAIRAGLSEWRAALRSHFMNTENADAAEVEAAIEDVTNKILGADVGASNFGTKITVHAAGPLKERLLDIPDERIEKFLVNDPIKVASSYIRDLVPQIEIAKRFGDVDMKQAMQNIADEYAILKKKAETDVKDPKELSARLTQLTDDQTKTQEAILRVRNRILGTAGRMSPDTGSRRAVNAARNWRNIVASSKMGVTALTGGLMDTAKIAATHGFLPTMRNMVKLTASADFRKMSYQTARRVGSAVEVAMSRRVQVSYDGAITEGWSQKLANGVYKYTGLNHITDFNRTLAATLTEDGILNAAERFAASKAIPKAERFRLASMGIGQDEIERIAEQFKKHGGEVDGTRVSGSANWDDKALSDIYDAAILKESRIAVQTPGAADRVWWMDKEIGKFFGQLKTFSLSSPSRLLAGGLQMAGHGDYARAARFFGFMMIGGYLTHATRQILAGKKPTTNPTTAANEAFTESGLGGVLPDLLSPFTRRITGSVRYGDRNPVAAYGGPAVGAGLDTWDALYNRTQGDFTASDLHAIRRLLPYQNIWWLRREINALEGEVAENFNLQGADSAGVGERLARTEALVQQ